MCPPPPGNPVLSAARIRVSLGLIDTVFIGTQRGRIEGGIAFGQCVVSSVAVRLTPSRVRLVDLYDSLEGAGVPDIQLALTS